MGMVSNNDKPSATVPEPSPERQNYPAIMLEDARKMIQETIGRPREVGERCFFGKLTLEMQE
jgi:hypothetical protein